MVEISPKKLLKMVRKWQMNAATGRKRISYVTADSTVDPRMSPKPVADKGHFIVYTVDGRRFMLPLSYLSSPMFIDLFKMSEDAFGLPGNGHITLPCDALLMEYIVSLVRMGASENVVEALLVSIDIDRCCFASIPDHQHSNKQILLHGC
ncbi:auxin-responsive protein SAUR64-like protein [Cinnamomum micranthum f. kanehirae]|uniref:Auxin-responsive protein SAUR64-like protein n=1 Tax=Cinnamomum micranthum f. kanehirae TaxID=337451 RepID=A0A3S3MYH5_9MAGN|nr:auxin-responsive protein SAUR64-like protein [Cinnamomum micranthum f. kanehirae]